MLYDEDSFDSDLDVDYNIHSERVVKEFISLVGEYKIATDMDRKLLLGVLVRDCHLRQVSDGPNAAIVQHRSGELEWL